MHHTNAARPSPYPPTSNRPRLVDSHEVPELSPPPPPTVTAPDGTVLTLARRGVRWSPILVEGCPVLCAPDSRGDIAHRWRPVPLDATPEQVDAIKRQLRELLDEADPPRLTLIRGDGA